MTGQTWLVLGGSSAIANAFAHEAAAAGHDVLLVSGFNDDPEKNEPVLKLLHL